MEELESAWCGVFMWGQSEKGNEVKLSMVGRDGYFETCRVAVETAMCLRFDRDKLQFQGGVLNTTVACGTHLLKRLRNDDKGIKFKMGEWHDESEWCPPPFPQ